MQLENQVTSLELSKRLKELGVKQESFFVWEYYDDKCYAVKFIPYAVVPHSTNQFKLYSAFTASELFALFPFVNYNPIELLKRFSFLEGIIYCCKCYVYNIDFDLFNDANPANCLAKMLTYLIENNLVKVEDVNNEK